MLAIVAVVLLLTPLAVLFICERAAKNGRGPLADPDHMPVLDPQLAPPPVFTDERQADLCEAEARLTDALLAGTLTPARYRTEMAVLAAHAGP
jgi:hypothetical protein